MRLRILATLWILSGFIIVAILVFLLSRVGLLGIVASVVGSLGILGVFSFPLRQWDEQNKSHSQELGVLFGTPEVFVGGAGQLTPASGHLLKQARDHLRSYRNIDRIIQTYATEDEKSRLAQLVLRSYLLEKARTTLRELYPGAVEWDMAGAAPLEFILPAQMAQDMEMDFAQFRTTGKRAGFTVIVDGTVGKWRVARSGATTYAVVGDRARCRERDLEALITRIVEGPDLLRLYTPLQVANIQAWTAHQNALTEIQKLAARVRHGHRLYGVCELGY